MTRWALPAVVLAACCKPPAAPKVEAPDEPPVVEAPPAPRFYEGLFREGAKWTFRVTREYESFVPDEEVEDGAPDEEVEETAEEPEPEERATCWVSETATYSTGRTSYIECETPEPRDAEDLTGAWLVDARGLWRTEGYDVVPGGDADLTGEEPFIALPPIEVHEETPDEPDPNVWEERTTFLDITQEGDDVWCRSDVYGATHGERFKLCLDETGPLWWSKGWDSVSDSEDARFDRID
jgi:hypothetical protein